MADGLRAWLLDPDSDQGEAAGINAAETLHLMHLWLKSHFEK